MPSTVAVVIVTFRRPVLLAELLNSVVNSDMPPAEVFVVDNDPELSVDSDRLPADCVVVPGGFGLNLAAARNAGWRHASSDYVLFVDDDNVIAADTMRLLAEALDRDDKLALAAPVIWESSGNVVWCGGVVRSPWSGRTVFLHRGSTSPPRTGTWATHDMPDAFMIRRRALEQVEGFDDHHFPIHYDEADLCARMQSKGWRCLVISGTSVRHFGFVGARPGEEYLRALELHGSARVAQMAQSRVLFHRLHSTGLKRLSTLAFMPCWLFIVGLSTMTGSSPMRARLDTVRALVRGTIQGYRTCA